MSTNRPSRSGDPPSLRDSIVDILNPGSSSRGPSHSENNHGLERARNEPHGSHEDDTIDGPNETTRLIEDYERRQSVCGLRECNHGTFSPKPELQEPGSLAGSYFWGSRTPRLMTSGLQTPATDGTSVTNRLITDMGVKNRRRMYVQQIHSVTGMSFLKSQSLIINTGIFLIMFHL